MATVKKPDRTTALDVLHQLVQVVERALNGGSAARGASWELIGHSASMTSTADANFVLTVPPTKETLMSEAPDLEHGIPAEPEEAPDHPHPDPDSLEIEGAEEIVEEDLPIGKLDKRSIAGTDASHFQKYRRVTLTKMFPAKGPLLVETAGGILLKLAPEWRGMIAVDELGHPYPVDEDVFRASYVKATNRDVIAHNQPHDASAQEVYAEAAIIAEEERNAASERSASQVAELAEEDPERSVASMEVQKPPPTPGRPRTAR